MSETPAREARESERLLRDAFQLMLNLQIATWYPFRRDAVVLIDMVIKKLNSIKVALEVEDTKKNG